MRSEAKVANSTMRGPVAPASRILSASASDRYSFFCGAALATPAGAALRIEARSNTAPGMVIDRMGHLTDLISANLRSGLRGKSSSISSF